MRKNFFIFLFILILSISLISCNKPIEKPIEKTTIIKENFYMIETNLGNSLNHEIIESELQNKNENQIIDALGKPLYIINYSTKENDEIILNGKVLIYTQEKSPTGTYIDIKNDTVCQSYTGEMNSMDLYKAESIVSILNNIK